MNLIPELDFCSDDPVIDDQLLMQREIDMVDECTKLIELVHGLQVLVMRAKINCFAEGQINWRHLSALHAIQVRTEEIIEQTQVIDVVRAKVFIDEATH